MTKPVVNNKIIYQNINGLVARHDSWLNQSIKTYDSPTFVNITINGDSTIRGNLYVEGNTTILNTNVIEFEDNIEECLDLLDKKYSSMSAVLEIPVFFDSIEVRKVINDINECRDSLVVVANKLTKNTRSKIETQEKN
mgnify:CR=1 FL=1